MYLHHLVLVRVKISENFGVEEKLDVISRLKKVNELLTRGIMLDLLIAVYIQFMAMLLELQKILRNVLKFLCCKTTTVLLE